MKVAQTHIASIISNKPKHESTLTILKQLKILIIQGILCILKIQGILFIYSPSNIVS